MIYKRHLNIVCCDNGKKALIVHRVIILTLDNLCAGATQAL